jgi:hypothetical protein
MPTFDAFLGRKSNLSYEKILEGLKKRLGEHVLLV